MISRHQFISHVGAACRKAGSRRAFAQNAGMTETMLSAILTGARKPSQKLVAALGYLSPADYEKTR
jgi:hypothetical protein